MQTVTDSEQPSPSQQGPESRLSPNCAPNLLVAWTPWYRDFFSTIHAHLYPPRIWSAKSGFGPAPFWPDVFVHRNFEWGPFRKSAEFHILLVVALWGVSSVPLLRTPPVKLQDPFAHQTITYYSVSEYLPPILQPGDSEPAEQAQKADPEYAPQHIESVHRVPDSHQQTIVAPPALKLPHDLLLPNMVASASIPAVPQAAVTHSASQLVSPALPSPIAPAPVVTHAGFPNIDVPQSVVPPAPDVDTAKLRTPLDIIAKTVVEPAPSLSKVSSKGPALPLPSAVEPPPSAHDLRRPGDLNIGAVQAGVKAPKLPIPAQRATGSFVEASAAGRIRTPARLASRAGTTGSVQAPSIYGPGGGLASREVQSMGQFLALSLHPAIPNGPIAVPEGNRSGTFAADPNGRHGASGRPEAKGGGKPNGAGGSGGATNGGTGSAHGSNPLGITVGKGPSNPSGPVIVAGQSPISKSSSSPLLAAMSRPKLEDLARAARPNAASPSTPERQIEDKVFAGKRYYSMVLNMPNLNSMGGTWVIRFAELHANIQKGEVTAPVATHKVDPAYPAELIRTHVEGTVILYAVIRSDGTVSGVRVLRSVDGRLDENARAALAKCRFRPGTKNGLAVDLEAVIQIPFVSHSLAF